MVPKMHADEVDVPQPMVRELVDSRLPALAGLTYYAQTVPAFSARGRRHLDAVLAGKD